MLPWNAELCGRLNRHTVDSVLLRENPLGDPRERPLWVYVPPGYDDNPYSAYPVIYVIQGYGAHISMWANRTPFNQPFIETADAVFADRESRAITGKSSGAFGAMITPMLRSDLFGALATHAGDTLYELSYIPVFAQAARALREFAHDISRWSQDFRSRTAFTKEADHALSIMLCGRCVPCGSSPATATSSTWTSAPRRSAPSSRRQDCPKTGCTSNCSTAATSAPTAATRSPSPGWSSAWPADDAETGFGDGARRRQPRALHRVP